MESRELRTGNYVRVINDTVREYFIVQDTNQSHFFEPIPLAEEWLVKMGFKKFVTSDKYHTYALGVINVNDNIVYVSELGFLNHIKYVHQLQNLYFDLTGEELTV